MHIPHTGVYISEVVHKSKRSQFGALQAVFLVIGIIAAQGHYRELFNIFCYRRSYENRIRNPRKYHAYVQSLIDITYAHQTCGYFFPWRTTAKILAAIPLVSAVAILLFPETPYWLIENGRVEEAR